MKVRRTAYLLLMMVLAQSIAVGEGEEQEKEEMWKEHPHHLSVVLAGTVEDGEEENEKAETLGIDYEYRLNDFLGIGAVVERAFDPLDTTTALFVADLHVWRGLAIQTGPGVEQIDRGDGEDKFVYRIGSLYEIERGRFTVSPQLHLDVTSEAKSVIFAVAFGFGF